jgi:hypothetical protein
MKPIIRWTIGGVRKRSGYQILLYSIEKIINFYGKEFDYFVCYNDVNNEEINKLKIRYKNVKFLKQKWESCPIRLKEPKKINLLKQKKNGSFWKICPPRLRINSHEIILDNDLLFLKKPKIIDQFLIENKNLIIEDCIPYSGDYFKKGEQTYNSGVIGLCPNYNFHDEIIKYWDTDKNEKTFDYDEEQGFLTYILLKSNPLIGKTENFCGIFSEQILSNSLQNHKLKNKNKFLTHNKKMLNEVFQNAEVVHFLTANRNQHNAWNYFKNFLLKKTL